MDLVTPGLGLIVWQTVLFLIILFLLGKFAWKPILGALSEREKAISDALASAKLAKLEMENLKAANEKLLQEARLERDKILSDAQVAANNIINEAKDKANSESSKLVASAKASIENEKQAALTEVKNLAANLSIEIAQKLLKKELENASAQRELVNAYIKEANLS
jgi:F-type H+-transporting ATPase subunit b